MPSLQSVDPKFHVNKHFNYYDRFTALWILSGTTRLSRYQKGKTRTNLDILEQCGTHFATTIRIT